MECSEILAARREICLLVRKRDQNIHCPTRSVPSCPINVMKACVGLDSQASALSKEVCLFEMRFGGSLPPVPREDAPASIAFRSADGRPARDLTGSACVYPSPPGSAQRELTRRHGGMQASSIGVVIVSYPKRTYPLALFLPRALTLSS